MLYIKIQHHKCTKHHPHITCYDPWLANTEEAMLASSHLCLISETISLY